MPQLTHKNVWVPHGYGTWHNLPPVLGKAAPETTMAGFAVAYAVCHADSISAVAAITENAYKAWQQGLVDEAFEEACFAQGAEGTSFDVMAAFDAITKAVQPLGGGQFLAEAVQYLKHGNPALDTQLGLMAPQKKPEATFVALKKLLNTWAEVYAKPNLISEDPFCALVKHLVSFSKEEIAEMPADFRREISHLHTLMVAREFLDEEHLVAAPLNQAYAQTIEKLEHVSTLPAINILADVTPPKPLGEDLPKLLQKAAEEGVYFAHLPRFMEGEVLTQPELEALQDYYENLNYADVLSAVFESPTYQSLPQGHGFLSAPKLNRQYVIERALNLKTQYEIKGDN